MLAVDNAYCTWRAQPCDSDLKERFLSLLCLFIYLFIYCHPHFSFYSFYSFWLSAYSYMLSAFFSTFFYPYFPIRHVQVSGPRFTDTQMEPMDARKFGYDVSVQRYARTPYRLWGRYCGGGGGVLGLGLEWLAMFRREMKKGNPAFFLARILTKNWAR